MTERVSFTPRGWEDYVSWQGQGGDKKLLRRINRLIKEIQRDPTGPGIGKPEKLVRELAGCHSRRINDEHRLVYRIRDDTITILSCRYHY